MNQDRYLVAALYHFAHFPDYQSWQPLLLEQCQRHDIRGTILLASEGLNGTIAGRPDDVRTVLAFIRARDEFAAIEHKESWCDVVPFHRMKVRLKREIVTIKREEADPQVCVGEYVDAKDWNALISDPDVILVDTRNDYEIEAGKFKGAISPHTEHFRQFPAYVEKELSDAKQRKVAMYCTGGIRCEKATALLRQHGFEHVYHLKGGILKYLETVPQEQSLWEGECFVFDDRVTVNHDLEKGSWELCFGCQQPLSPKDRESSLYRPGVHCANCYDNLSPQRLVGLEERHRQILLSRERGEQHVGH